MSRGVRFLTGSVPTARALPRYYKKPALEPFSSAYQGNCRGCGMPYQAGDKIVCPGKGLGGYHPKCFHSGKTTQRKRSQRQQTAWQIAAWAEKQDAQRRAQIKARRASEAKET